jgi:hypothetical protein
MVNEVDESTSVCSTTLKWDNIRSVNRHSCPLCFVLFHCKFPHIWHMDFETPQQFVIYSTRDKKISSESIQTTRYASLVSTDSSEKMTSSSVPVCFTVATRRPAILPWPTNETLTGKKAPGSSPPTVNSRDPEISDFEISGMDQSREWLDGLMDQSPEWEETVGYEPCL